jgi:hypothetical protein
MHMKVVYSRASLYWRTSIDDCGQGYLICGSFVVYVLFGLWRWRKMQYFVVCCYILLHASNIHQISEMSSGPFFSFLLAHLDPWLIPLTKMSSMQIVGRLSCSLVVSSPLCFRVSDCIYWAHFRTDLLVVTHCQWYRRLTVYIYQQRTTATV